MKQNKSTFSTHCIKEHFGDIPDPRSRKPEHPLDELLFMALCAVICGAESWVEIEDFGHAKIDWFSRFLVLPNGIPSHDTFGRVFSGLSANAFEQAFVSWVSSLVGTVKGVVAIDGKTMRRSHNKKAGKSAIHMVSAWSVENRVVLGQVSTQEKSNEITAIPELLKALEIQGCVITIDAMGCQRKIAQEILDKDADYVLALKGNQDHIHHDTQHYFRLNDESADDKEMSQSNTTERNRNRLETRNCTVIKAPEAMIQEYSWPGLSSLCRIESERTLDGVVSTETRYYLSSLESDAKRHSEIVRAHWGVENPLHWVLDVAFNEDSCRVREKNSAENFSVLRRMALNLIRQDKSSKTGVKGKRLRAGWDSTYLEKLLGDMVA